LSPPNIGTVLTVKHSGYYTNGRLREPFFWRVCEGILWKDIVQQA